MTPQVLSAVTDDSEIFKKNFTMYVYKYQKDHIEEELYMLFTYVRPYFFFLNKEPSKAEKFVDLKTRFLGTKFLLYFQRLFHLELGTVFTNTH